MIVLNQTCQLLPGAASCPTTTITLAASDWASLVSGQMDAFGAVLAGRMRIDGDMTLATRLPGPLWNVIAGSAGFQPAIGGGAAGR